MTVDQSATSSVRIPPLRLAIAVAVVVSGAVATAISLNLPAGDSRFVPSALVLASVWTFGAILLGLGGSLRMSAPQGVGRAIALGVALCIASAAGGAVVRFVPVIGDIVKEVLSHSASGSLLVIAAVTAFAGIGEELFFRGALYSLIPTRPMVVTTVIYALVTLASGNLMLVGAAFLVGGVTAYQRHLTGGLLIPVVTHVVWAMTMLFALPPLLG